MRLFLSLFALVILFLAITPCFADSSSNQSSENIQSEESFLPLDTAPRFSDFSLALQFQANGFSKWIFPLLEEDSFKKVNATTALSDHYITWGEIATFFTSVGTLRLEPLNFFSDTELKSYVDQLYNHIISKGYGIYEAKKESAHQAAYLPQAIFQCYANWREVRYWLYKELLGRERALRNALEFEETPSKLTTYFKEQELLPIVDPRYFIDHLFEILVLAPRVGIYLFSIEDGTVKSINDQSTYRLANSEEIAIFKASQNDDSNIASSEKDGYGLLAINTAEMEVLLEFQKQEKKLEEAQANHYASLLASNQQEINDAIASVETTASTIKLEMEILNTAIYWAGQILLLHGCVAACFKWRAIVKNPDLDKAIWKKIADDTITNLKKDGFSNAQIESMKDEIKLNGGNSNLANGKTAPLDSKSIVAKWRSGKFGERSGEVFEDSTEQFQSSLSNLENRLSCDYQCHLGCGLMLIPYPLSYALSIQPIDCLY